MKVIDVYELLAEPTPEELNKAVQHAINNAFQPFGSPFYTGDRFCQAIVFLGEEEA